MPVSTQTEQKPSFMLKLSTFIVDKRNLVFLIVIIALNISYFASSWVTVEDDLNT